MIGRIQDPIATRTLTCDLDGRRQDVTVSIGRPYEDENCYVCEYEITVGHSVTALKICGLDGIQAIQLAIRMLGSALEQIEGATDWRVENETGTGLPSFNSSTGHFSE